MADRIAEIRARLEAATPAKRPYPDYKANAEFIAHSPEDIAYLLERVEKLKAENADLRRAVPLINDDGETVWPSVHDNPTVLRAMLFDAHARIEKLEAVLEAAEGAYRWLQDAGVAARTTEALRAAIEAAQ